MSDSLTSLYLSNPQLAVALRQQSMAMPYIQAGIDSSPIRSPLQGLGRLADALVGRVLYNRGNDQIQSAISNQQAAQQQNDADYQRVLAGALTGQQAPASTAPQPPPQAEGVPATIQRDPKQTAGMQGNNPGNLMFAGQPDASGIIPMSGGRQLAAFPNMATGVAANVRQLVTNADAHGIQTTEQMVKRWVGDPNADLTSYIADTSKALGVKPTDPVNWHDPAVQAAFIKAQYPHESAGGSTSLQDADVIQGVRLANAQARGPQLAQAGNVATDAIPPQGIPGGGAGQGGAPGGAMPPTGMDSPNVAQAMRMMQTATQIEMRSPYDPKAKIQAAGLRQQAQAIMGMDSFQTLPDGTIVNLRTGQRMNAPTPALNYQEDPNHPGVLTSPGAKPVVLPSPRVFQTPSGNVGAVGPGGNITPIEAANNQGVAARKQAEAQGAEAGKDAPTVKDMVAMGREADQAISNIDYGVNQLHQAAAGGIPTGKAAPWMADAAAWAKSLGVDTRGFGVDPNAVSNVQAGAKTLAVLGGRIIQQAIGPDSQITEGKVQAFVHAHPDLANDPGAIEKILGWARSQYVYNRDMSFDAMKNADKTTGIIPPGWQADYIARKGAFSPIYDPLSKEMKQPEGQGPAREMPQAVPQPQAQPAAPQYREGQTATRGDGHRIIFRSGQWQPM